MARFLLALIYAFNLSPVQAWAANIEGPAGAGERPVAPIEGLQLRSPAELPTVPLITTPAVELPASVLPQTPALSAALPAAAASPSAAIPAAAPAARPTVAGRLRAFGAAAARVFSRPAAAAVDRRRVDFTQEPSPRSGDAEPVLAAPSSETPGALARPPTEEKKKDPAAPKIPAPRGLRAYIGGTFGAQLANNALQVTLPLLLLQVSGPAAAAWVTAVSTGFDTVGTLVGGWLSSRTSPATVLVVSSLARAAIVAALPVLMMAHAPGVALLAAVACGDAFARGIADTSRKTVPTILASDGDGYKKINAAYQTAFEAGGVVGPVLIGLFMARLGGLAAQWVAPIAFAAIAAVYFGVPRVKPQAAAGTPSLAEAKSASSPLKNPWFRRALLATALLTLYPLKGVLPALFASGVLHHASATAWLVALFGVGGVIGSRAYARWNKKLSMPGWLKLGALGAVVLSLAWLPASFWPAAAAVLIFASANSAARVALDSEIQERVQGPAAGSAIGWARFSANITSASIRFLVGAAFAVAAGASGWWLVGTGIAVVAALSWWNAARLGGTDWNFPNLKKIAPAGALLGAGLMVGGVSPAAVGPRPSPVHGFPGRLIVVEGLDGSGKSTQLERLKDHLEAKGLKVVTTSWNSSELLSETVKKAKAERRLDARTFSHLNAADLNERLKSTILPALREGAVVLADRWFFTALARDSVRGNDPAWLRGLYADAPRPDLTLYFKLPVDVAVDRVLKRAREKVGLSEDFAEEGSAKVLGQNYYAVGRDLNFSPDDEANFREFQTRVVASYDAQMREFGFRAVDAAKSREIQEAAIAKAVDSFLGPVESFKKRDPKEGRPNIFDKDPAGDAPNIRANYLHEKKGAHFYFRNALLPMQERFAQLVDVRTMPRVFLHGSPHVDNYAKTAQGAAMVDFDRSRVGPYAWDLVRLMVSLSLRRKKDRGFLDADVLKQLKKGYLHGLRHPNRPFSEMRKLKNTEPADDEVSMNAYLQAGKKWAKEMRQAPLPADDPTINALVDGYLANNGESRDDYTIEEAGRGSGSMGFRAIYLVVLKPKNPRKDRLLLNFKQDRTDPDTEWYKNPYETESERMLAAAKLYAPGWELAPGWVKLGGIEYYVRGIPPQNAKLKKMLSLDEQLDFAYSVGTQLGRAHALSLRGEVTPEQLEERLKSDFDDIVAAGETIRGEIVDAHARYLKRMKKEGLEPPSSETGDE